MDRLTAYGLFDDIQFSIYEENFAELMDDEIERRKHRAMQKKDSALF